MKFEHFQLLMNMALPTPGNSETSLPPADQFSPLVLAYIGDAFFNLYVRTALLRYERNKVQILHTYGAQMVSASMQAFALRELSVFFNGVGSKYCAAWPEHKIKTS